MVQLLSTFSSPVSLSVSAALTKAPAQFEHVTGHAGQPEWGAGTCMGYAPLKSSAGSRKCRASARAFACPLHVNFGPYPVGASVLDVTVLRRPMVLDAATKARMN